MPPSCLPPITNHLQATITFPSAGLNAMPARDHIEAAGESPAPLVRRDPHCRGHGTVKCTWLQRSHVLAAAVHRCAPFLLAGLVLCCCSLVPPAVTYCDARATLAFAQAGWTSLRRVPMSLPKEPMRCIFRVALFGYVGVPRTLAECWVLHCAALQRPVGSSALLSNVVVLQRSGVP